MEEKPYKILMTLMGMEIGGAETHVLELSKTLQRMGLSVHVVSNGGVYVQELEECGVKHYQVPLHNKQFINMFSSYRALRQIIIENDFKLVHAHARIPAFICGWVRRLNRKHPFKLVTTAHLDFSVKFPFNKLSNWGDRTLAVSQDIKDYLLENYKIDEENISLTVNAINTEKFAPGIDASDVIKEFGLSEDTIKIVSLSRLDKDRSLASFTLVDIAEKIVAVSKKPIEIIIVGDGDDFANFTPKVDAVNKRVGRELIKLTGQRTDTHKFVGLADIFVNVSRSALEAMSTGTPVILAGNQGYLGILNEETKPIAVETNFTCRNAGDLTPEKLLADIGVLLDMHEEEFLALGAWGRNLAITEYSLERMAKDAIDVYKNILSERDKPPVNVVIFGSYGQNNSGDDIILKSIVQNLRERRNNINLTVLSRKPKEIRKQFQVDAVHRFNLISVFSRIRKAKLLIAGGGNLIQDETSTQSLLYYLWLINTARSLGVLNMLYANGIGAINNPRNISRSTRVLNRVELITLREEGSLKLLNEMGVTAPAIHVTADASFALPFPKIDSNLPASIGVTGKFFCVALRPWANNPPNLEEQIALFADELINTYDYQAVFVPMRPEQDTDIAKRVMALMANKNKSILLEPALQDYNLARSILGLASFAVCMRLHALIFAMEKGVPAIGLVYSPKIREFMDTMNQQWYMPVEETNIETLVEYSSEIHKNIDSISEEIYNIGLNLRERAAKNADLCIKLLEGGIV